MIQITTRLTNNILAFLIQNNLHTIRTWSFQRISLFHNFRNFFICDLLHQELIVSFCNISGYKIAFIIMFDLNLFWNSFWQHARFLMIFKTVTLCILNFSYKFFSIPYNGHCLKVFIFPSPNRNQGCLACCA